MASPGPSFWSRFVQRKLIQWALAYLAGAWVLYEVAATVGGHWGLPDILYRGLFVVLAVGLLAGAGSRSGGRPRASSSVRSICGGPGVGGIPRSPTPCRFARPPSMHHVCVKTWSDGRSPMNTRI